MSHQRRTGPTGHAKNSKCSPDILVEETVIGSTEESDSSETFVDQTATLIPYFIKVPGLTTTLKLIKHQRNEIKTEKLTMKKK